MELAPRQPPSLHLCWLLWAFLFHKMPLVSGSLVAADCSGHFVVEDSTVKLLIQQYVNSTDTIVECRYTFEAPQHSGLLVIANDIRSVNDAEIPGCPASIYSYTDASGDPIYSLCGHYGTMTIPVPASVALVVYKPQFNGQPYTVTLNLQVVLTGGSKLRICGDSQLSAVSAVPVKYSVGFRADAGSGDVSDWCDLNVTSKDSVETLGASCALTSEGVCSYEVLFSNGTPAETPEHVDLSAAGGSATIRLHPVGVTGVLVSSLPAGFQPVTLLEPLRVISNSTSETNGTINNVTDGATIQVVTVDVPVSFWKKTGRFFSNAWKKVKHAFKTLGNWFRG
uniref:Putative secreted protein n=1 Tax=Amblyomma triste TaxID=251400 RepID=A0A023G292_AMBTT